MNNSRDRIEVRGLELLLYCGVLPEEQARRQPLLFDLDLYLDLSAAGSSDDLEDTVNYGALIDQLNQTLPAERFQLLTDRGALREYTFNTGVARHWFCGNCGIKSFYRPRSHPDGISVNVRCLDLSTATDVIIEPFDGEHWEDNVVQLAPLQNE